VNSKKQQRLQRLEQFISVDDEATVEEERRERARQYLNELAERRQERIARGETWGAPRMSKEARRRELDELYAMAKERKKNRGGGY
jgi:hypothetical protein